MATILNGTKCAQEVQAEIIKKLETLKQKAIVPFLAVVLVGDDQASQVYVNRKEKLAKQLGIATKTYILPTETTFSEVKKLIINLNNDTSVHGILVQMPLPKHIDAQQILMLIDPNKDVDGFHPLNMGLLIENRANLVPCTPAGIMSLLKKNKIELTGKHCVIVGRSQIVGKPLSQLFLNEDATVTICHSKTKNLINILQQADIVVMAIGQANFLQPEMIKEGVILIDVGINRNKEGIIGDIAASCYQKASAYTPVPGGVGPMTLAMLMKQTVEIAMRGIN